MSAPSSRPCGFFPAYLNEQVPLDRPSALQAHRREILPFWGGEVENFLELKLELKAKGEKYTLPKGQEE